MGTQRAWEKGGSPGGFFSRDSFLNSSYYQLPLNIIQSAIQRDQKILQKYHIKILPVNKII